MYDVLAVVGAPQAATVTGEAWGGETGLPTMFVPLVSAVAGPSGNDAGTEKVAVPFDVAAMLNWPRAMELPLASSVTSAVEFGRKPVASTVTCWHDEIVAGETTTCGPALHARYSSVLSDR